MAQKQLRGAFEKYRILPMIESIYRTTDKAEQPDENDYVMRYRTNQVIIDSSQFTVVSCCIAAWEPT